MFNVKKKIFFYSKEIVWKLNFKIDSILLKYDKKFRFFSFLRIENKCKSKEDKKKLKETFNPCVLGIKKNFFRETINGKLF